MSRNKALGIIFLYGTVLMLPAFLLGAGGWDLHCQSLFTRLFADQFWHGNLYPRWLMDMFAGDGSPVFFCYPPLTYFIAALAQLISPADPFGYYPIAVTGLAATWLAGLTAYFWLQEEAENGNASLIGALLYMAAPGCLAQNFYFSMMPSSVLAYAWLPLLLLFGRRVALGSWSAVAGYAIALLLLLLTNLPVTLLYGPLSVAYAALFTSRTSWQQAALRLGVAIGLGFSLSAFYLLPSLLYMHYTSVSLEWTRAKLVRTPFITSLKGEHGFWYGAYWLLSLLSLAVWHLKTPRTPRKLFCIIVSALALVMMLPISAPVWDALPLLAILQMSERFFMVVSPLLCLLAALAFPSLRRVCYVLLALYTGIAGVTAWNTRTTLESFRSSEPDRFNAFTHNVEQYASYLPSTDLMQRFGTADGLKDVLADREKVRAISGEAETSVLEWKPRHILLHYRAPQPATLRIRQFYFPGWQATLGQEILSIGRDDVTGELLITAPAGEGTILLELTAMLPEVAGKMITILSALCLLLVMLWQVHRKKLSPGK